MIEVLVTPDVTLLEVNTNNAGVRIQVVSVQIEPVQLDFFPLPIRETIYGLAEVGKGRQYGSVDT